MTATGLDSNADGREGSTQARRTIIATDKGIAIVSPLGSVDDLIRLFERNVHVAVNGLQLACQHSRSERCAGEFDGGGGRGTPIDDARVKLHSHRIADDFTQEDGRVFSFGLGDGAVFHCGWVSAWAGCLAGSCVGPMRCR